MLAGDKDKVMTKKPHHWNTLYEAQKVTCVQQVAVHF
jgi:hypothetical protein